MAPADADAVLAAIADIPLTVDAKRMRTLLDTYLCRVEALQRGSSVGAANAKKDGPALIKVINASLKRAAAADLAHDLAGELLKGVMRELKVLQAMQNHLTCSALDLEKISQNLILKLAERELRGEALEEAQQMLVRLYAAGQKKRGSKCAAAGWQEALANLAGNAEAGELAASGRNSEECALVLGCLTNLATLPVQAKTCYAWRDARDACGPGCAAWLEVLRGQDKALAARLASSLYRAATKAAVAADTAAAAETPQRKGSVMVSEAMGVAVQLRGMSLVYLACSGKVGLPEVLSQVVKTSRFYDSKCRAALPAFHDLLATCLVPHLTAAAPDETLAAALADWACAFASSYVRGTGRSRKSLGAGSTPTPVRTPAREGEGTARRSIGGGASTPYGDEALPHGVLLRLCGAMEQAAGGTPPSRAWARALLGALTAAVTINLAPALLASPRKGSAAKVTEELRAAVAAAAEAAAVLCQDKSAMGGERLLRLGAAGDVVRTACAALCLGRREGWGDEGLEDDGRAEERRALEDALVASLEQSAGLLEAAARCPLAGGAPARTVALKNSVEQLAGALLLYGSTGCNETRTAAPTLGALRALLARQPALLAVAAAATGPLYNAAAARYNSSDFMGAVWPLQLACEACAPEPAMLKASPALAAQLAKRLRMLAFCLHKTARAGDALSWVAQAAIILALGGDLGAACAALAEGAVLRAAASKPSQGAAGRVGSVLSLAPASLRTALGEDAEVELQLAELDAAMRSRVPDVRAALGLCDELLDAPTLASPCDGDARAPALQAQALERRGRVALERLKLERLATGGMGAGRREDRGAGPQGVDPQINEVFGALWQAAALWDNAKEPEGVLRVALQAVEALAWRAALSLNPAWTPAAAEAAATALRILKAVVPLGHMCHADARARAVAHARMLGDILGLHGQNVLARIAALTAAELAAARGDGEDDASNEAPELAAQLMLLAVTLATQMGLPVAARRVLSQAPGGSGTGLGLKGVAEAAVAAADGHVDEAQELLARSWPGEKNKFPETLPQGVGSEHAAAAFWEVSFAERLTSGDVPGSLHAATRALHATLSPLRAAFPRISVDVTGTTITAKPGRGCGKTEKSAKVGSVGKVAGTASAVAAEEGQESAPAGPSQETASLAGAVVGSARQASHWSGLSSALEALARAGAIHAEAGLAREALYYLEQGLQMARAAGAGAWEVRMLALLARLRDAQGLGNDARALREQASALADTLAFSAAPALAFLARERAELALEEEGAPCDGETGKAMTWGRPSGPGLAAAAQLLAQCETHEMDGGDAALGVASRCDEVTWLIDQLTALAHKTSILPSDSKVISGQAKTKGPRAPASEGGRVGGPSRGVIQAGEMSRDVASLSARVRARTAEASRCISDLREALEYVPRTALLLRVELRARLGEALLADVVSDTQLEDAVEALALDQGGDTEMAAGTETIERLPHASTLEKLKVAELKALLDARNMSTTGKKAQLVERLTALAACQLAAESTPVAGCRTAKSALGGAAGALALLEEAWAEVHPSGPPALIKRVGRGLCAALSAARGDEESAVDQAALRLACVGVMARQQWAVALGLTPLSIAAQNSPTCEEYLLQETTSRVKALSVGTACDGAADPEHAMAAKRASAMGGKTLAGSRRWLSELQAALPKKWAVVCLTAESNGRPHVTRMETSGVVRSAGLGAGVLGTAEVLDEFEEIMLENKAGLMGGGEVKGSEGKKRWWAERAALDKRLGALLDRVDRAWVEEGAGARLLSPGGEHLVLLLDDSLAALPWESLPSLRAHSISRFPTAALLAAALAAGDADCGALLDPRDGFFVLNPAGDLPHTQAMFEESFRYQRWTGAAGQPPAEADLLRDLSSRSLFAYCGHGAGERYVAGDKVRSLAGTGGCATAVLMGCSSARLKREGVFEPRGMVLSYLIGGARLAVGNLWDVSDRDIDRFADSLFRRAVFLPDTPQPPAAAATDAPPAAGVTSFARRLQEAAQPASSDANSSFVSCVALAREDVRMKYLIGAAPVCPVPHPHIKAWSWPMFNLHVCRGLVEVW